MRTIKFRGLRTDGNGWVYGGFVEDPHGKLRIYYKPFKEATSNTYHFVTPESVGQFTGLLDKNGKEIYEGDVVCFYINGLFRKEVLEFRNYAFTIGLSLNFYLYQLDSVFNTLESIGNIHENPDLL